MTDFLNSAVSGINAANSRLGLVSNNLANSNTIGFKSQDGEFRAIYAGEDGVGVAMAGVNTNFNTGSISQTGNPLNHALVGDGLFIVEDANKIKHYTRAGLFDFDANGHLTDSKGNFVQCFPVDGERGETSSIYLNKSPLKPTPTTEATIAANLGLDATASTTLTTTLSIFDDVGSEHKCNIEFSNRVSDPKTGKVSWDLTAKFDNNPLALPLNKISILPNGKIDLNTSPLKDGIMNVDLSAVTPKLSGVGSIKVDLSRITGYDTDTSIQQQKTDGNTVGMFSKFEVGKNGIISTYYDNGEVRDIGQIAIATVANYRGLKESNDGYFETTHDAGEIKYGVSGDAGFGKCISSSIETSNVNTTQQLVDLINAQRSFQMCSKVIGASKEINTALLQAV
ncbi:flagellar hook protein FlgE [Photobacterium damselae]|uniref:flagellar hook protein FlgE n=1 Tax=Photobacterium damselae TaxID=38293 RepID=UPI001F310326|nr:flagellar hook-basal body complex protein [Photobacterium damselae]UKA04624.1 flagellar hook-basal body complex protein [Photobacterium damselae subsp. damselae]